MPAESREELRKRTQNVAVLGLSIGNHDTAACVVVDGTVVAASEQERINRERSTATFPIGAITDCMHAAGLAWEDISTVAVANDIYAYSPLTALHYLAGYRRSWSEVMCVAKAAMRTLRMEDDLTMMNLGAWTKKRVIRVPHHVCHAASAFFASPFESATVSVIDGVGDLDTISIFSAEGLNLRRVIVQRYPHSLGKLYGSICRYLGFYGPTKEGKVMALAPFGDGSLINTFSALVKHRAPIPEINMDYFRFGLCPSYPSIVSPEFTKLFGPARRKGEALSAHYMAVARALQFTTEVAIVDLIRHAVQSTGKQRLALAGGVALNCVVNSRIRSEADVAHMYVPPSPHDAGLALGAAYMAHVGITGNRPEPLSTPFLGIGYSDAQIEQAVQESSFRSVRCADPTSAAVDLLERFKIIGWFQGRYEFGPRALGNRSILADPRTIGVRDELNKIIKQREWFRPFAPAVPFDLADTVFESINLSPYMLETFTLKPHWRQRMPAVTHIDGSARVQTVTIDDNPLFYQLLKEFWRRTGIPSLLNTSLNGQGEPIARSPQDAIKILDKTELQCLVLGKYVLLKNSDAKLYSDQAI